MGITFLGGVLVGKKYDESSITVLKGLEPVKQRPGMYTRTENPLHILQEVIDNSADEALAGYSKSVSIICHEDESYSIVDDGRGVPVGLHPNEKIPVIEIVYTKLHSGGKFEKGIESAYAFSGGLHGVGVSVTNALSKKVEVTVWRQSFEWGIIFENGEVVSNLAKKKQVRNKTGTSVRVWPDNKYFDSKTIPLDTLKNSLRARAVLLPGVKFTFDSEIDNSKQTWFYENGLADYFSQNILGSDFTAPIWESESYVKTEDDFFSEGEGAKWILAFSNSGPIIRESYVNLIPTLAGGTHEAGFKEGIFQAVKSFIEQHKMLPKGTKLLSEDVFSRISFILSAKVLDPQFQGQTKEKLTSRDALRLISSRIKGPFEIWLHKDTEIGKKIADLVIHHAQLRQRASKVIERKRSSSVAVLPGKLTDCESKDINRNELFLVEGDSAGGSAKMGRDKLFQAILPLRGKVLNTWEADKLRLLANSEVHDISVAIGIDPHDENNFLELTNLRYGKICILSDADVDGSHIQVLLLTLFIKHFPRLVSGGYIYISRPPLYRIDVEKRGKKPPKKIYALDEKELDGICEKLNKEGFTENHFAISRFKGLGEMNADQLWETTLNPDTRRLMPVKIEASEILLTKQKFNMLMAKGESSSRRSWLEKMSDKAQVDL